MNRQTLAGVAQDVETKVEDAPDGSNFPPGAIIHLVEAWASPVLAAIGVFCWRASIGQIHPYSVGDSGLVSQLSPRWWLGLTLVLAAVVLELGRDTPRLVAMVVSLTSMALVLHGTLPAAEVTPRFNPAYDVAGFADFIGRHGQTLPLRDARMSWPGMLSADGMLAQAMHVPTLWFARWAPLILNLTYLLPVKAIANVSLRTSRARWTALPIFLVANWIDQDYFSPQGIDLLLYLTIIAIAIRTFATQGVQPKLARSLMATRPYRVVTSRLPRLVWLPSEASPGELIIDDTTTARRAGIFGLAVFLVAVLVVSHQFTPLALGVVLLGLSLAGRTRLKSLWLLVVVLAFAWLSWEARTYWSGHLHVIFGGVGNVGTVLGSNVTRLTGVSSGRLDVQRARLAASLITWLGAGFGFFVLWRRGRTQWTLAILLAAPLVVAVGLNYGGEIALRILLFSLAPCSIFISGLVDRSPLRRRTIVACLVVVGLLAALFPLIRYGNESFEAMAPGDLAAASWIHANVPAGATIWVANNDNPLNSQDIERYAYAHLREPTATTEREFTAAVRNVPRGAWIYLSRSQQEYASVFEGGIPQNWVNLFALSLVVTKRFRILFHTPTAFVMHVIAPTTATESAP